MKTEYDYLDHGYVRYIDHMGSDESICKFARTSFGKQDNEKTYDEDTRLINYLFEHYHTSPIESCEISVQLKMPIFVMRQHVRHRTASLNEASLRYSKHDGDFYVPTPETIWGQDAWNKQASGELLDENAQQEIPELIREMSQKQLALYNDLIEKGLAREKARMVLGTNFYTTVCWKIDLKNLFHYLRLRNDPHAQWEIQQLAACLEEMVKELWPRAYAAYKQFWKDSVSLSPEQLAFIQDHVVEALDEEGENEIRRKIRRGFKNRHRRKIRSILFPKR